jgi:Zn-dependent M28 family amino/carboxypeptidase
MKLVLLFFAAFLILAYGCETPSGTPAAAADIDTTLIKENISILASDEFQGRKPFTESGKKTIQFLEEKFKSYGLAPGNGDSYLQKVPLVELTAFPSQEMTIEGGKQPVALQLSDEFVAYSELVDEEIQLDNSEVVFAGYGIVAPEYNWNDYQGLDVKGKTVIVMVNDPGFAGGDSTFFKGETMTYYGRWTYKYEEAARQGADGVLIIHETVPAGYPWLVVKNSWSGAALFLDQDRSTPKCKVQGWITREAALRIFDASAVDMKGFAERARTQGFKPVELGLALSVSLNNTIKRDQSHNVVATIPGADRPEETIIYSAHWDHLGIGPAVDGDSIYNGAHDNASGTATMLELARVFATGPVPDRTLVFLAVTAEEQGLLGSKYYAENPLFPIDQSVANINLDGINAHGAMRDFTVVGYGQSTLDDLAETFVKQQGRYIYPDPDPGKGFFFRSDHFNFAKQGVPAMFAYGYYEMEQGGVERVAELNQEYLAKRYHRPADEFEESIWNFQGVYQDALIYYQMGFRLANSEDWPEWKSGSEFKAIRE